MRVLKIVAGTLVLAALLGVGLVAAVGVVLGHEPVQMLQALVQRTPGELVRYAQRRLEGHPRLEAVALPVLHAVQRSVERPVPALLPSLGKGQQPRPLAPVRYGDAGQPLAQAPMADGAAVAASADDLLLHDTAGLAAAMQNARPGQHLVIAPGRYRIDRPLYTRNAGTPNAPIVVTAAWPGTVTLEVAVAEGFVVNRPYWVFENLHLRGVCRSDDACEHAFHVVGAARSTVLRNNLIEDFNAHVKVNGHGGLWPDDGLLQFNTLRNGEARRTEKPVTPVDVVAASGWQVADNVIAHFVKPHGNGVSFGVFMKGAGQQGRIERNLVICTAQDVSQPGVRVGLSFGGGGTGPQYCRDGRCDAEHRDGLIANNVVAHCNDAGIYVFRSAGTRVLHNTLVNTAGIDVRVAPAQALVQANVLEGRVRERDGGLLEERFNLTGRIGGSGQADALELEPPSAAQAEPAARLQDASTDFCGAARPDVAAPGALAQRVPCAVASSSP